MQEVGLDLGDMPPAEGADHGGRIGSGEVTKGVSLVRRPSRAPVTAKKSPAEALEAGVLVDTWGNFLPLQLSPMEAGWDRERTPQVCGHLAAARPQLLTHSGD